MSDETPDKNGAPASTASDDAHAPAVPHFSRPGKVPARPVEPTASAVKSSTDAVSDDKNSGNDVAKDKADLDTTQPQEKVVRADAKSANDPITAATPTSKRQHKPVVKADARGHVPRPLTAGEYARTTHPSPSTTAVIPAVRDDLGAVGASESQVAAEAAAGSRQASLKLVRVDPWTVTKVTFALTVAMMIVAVVAVTILWIVLSIAGVWDQINSSVATVLSDDSGSFDITEYLGFTRLVGLTLVLSAINVVITTAVATIGAYLYNLAALLLGGVDVTLAEED